MSEETLIGLKAGNLFTLDGLKIPDNTDQATWAEIHKDILKCKAAASTWLNQSRKFAIGKWGVEYAAEAEAQLELKLGLPQPEEKPKLNPDDKSRALVTIEGISQSFSLWKRKMASEIPYWSRDQKERALDLLEPLAQQYKEIKQSLD